MTAIPVLVEAKKEYTNQLQQILTPRLFEGFKSIYEELLDTVSEEIYEKKTQSTSIVKLFQKSLKDIPLWNIDMIKNEHNRIEKVSNCDYLDNLVEAVFITNTKILTSVQINSTEAMNVQINVPQTQHFIHKCYIECSKELYKNPYVFDVSKTLTAKEKHTNLRETLAMINNSIQNAVRNLLPIRDILKQGLTGNNYSELKKTTSSNLEQAQETNQDDDEEDNDNEQDVSSDDENSIEEQNHSGSDENNEDEDDNEDENNDDNDGEEDENDDIKGNSLQEGGNNSFHEEINDRPSLLQANSDDTAALEKMKESLRAPEEEKKIIFLEKNGSAQNSSSLSANEIVKVSSPQEEDVSIQSITNDLIMQKNSQEAQEEETEFKKIQLGGENSILKKIDTIQKNENTMSTPPSLNEVLKPLASSSSSKIPTSSESSSNKFIKKMNHKQFVRKMPSGSQNNTKSFYQKKYDENLANFNFTSEAHSEEETQRNISSLMKKGTSSSDSSNEYKFINLNESAAGGDDSDIDFDS
jgi:hypothetical protein